MIYPYKNKFLTYDEIAPAMNGTVRIIEFRCFENGVDGLPDPSITNEKNWVIAMTEGSFINGKREGFCRTFNAFNGRGELGFFKDGNPFGKQIKFNAEGKVTEEGIYEGGKCKEKFTGMLQKIDNFHYNIDPVIASDPNAK